MKIKVALLSAVTVCMLSASTSTVFAQATATETKTLPSAKEVLANYVKAIGGKEAYESMKTVSVKGTFEMKAQGISAKISTVIGPGGKNMTTVEIPNVGTEKEGSDGKTYWSVSAFTGSRILKGKELLQKQMAADLQAELHADKYFKSMKVTGIEDVNGDPAYRLERVSKEDSKHVDFYSVKTGLNIKSESEAESPLGVIKVASYPSDYRKVGKILMPFKVEQVMPTAKILVTMKEVTPNKKLDDSMFELPETIAKMKAKAAK